MNDKIIDFLKGLKVICSDRLNNSLNEKDKIWFIRYTLYEEAIYKYINDKDFDLEQFMKDNTILQPDFID